MIRLASIGDVESPRRVRSPSPFSSSRIVYTLLLMSNLCSNGGCSSGLVFDLSFFTIFTSYLSSSLFSCSFFFFFFFLYDLCFIRCACSPVMLMSNFCQPTCHPHSGGCLVFGSSFFAIFTIPFTWPPHARLLILAHLTTSRISQMLRECFASSILQSVASDAS